MTEWCPRIAPIVIRDTAGAKPLLLIESIKSGRIWVGMNMSLTQLGATDSTFCMCQIGTTSLLTDHRGLRLGVWFHRFTLTNHIEHDSATACDDSA